VSWPPPDPQDACHGGALLSYWNPELFGTARIRCADIGSGRRPFPPPQFTNHRNGGDQDTGGGNVQAHRFEIHQQEVAPTIRTKILLQIGHATPMKFMTPPAPTAPAGQNGRRNAKNRPNKTD